MGISDQYPKRRQRPPARLRRSKNLWPPRLWTVNGWLILGGWLSLAIGTIGVLLPLLPTVPFYLLAAYLFSRGSKVLHRWIRSRPHIGAAIRDWENGHVIRTPAKWMSTGGIVLLFASTLVFVYKRQWLLIFLGVLYGAVLVFIWSRPAKFRGLNIDGRTSAPDASPDIQEKAALKIKE